MLIKGLVGRGTSDSVVVFQEIIHYMRRYKRKRVWLLSNMI